MSLCHNVYSLAQIFVLFAVIFYCTLTDWVQRSWLSRDGPCIVFHVYLPCFSDSFSTFDLCFDFACPFQDASFPATLTLLVLVWLLRHYILKLLSLLSLSHTLSLHSKRTTVLWHEKEKKKKIVFFHRSPVDTCHNHKRHYNLAEYQKHKLCFLI